MKSIDRASSEDERRFLQLLTGGQPELEVAQPTVSPTHYLWVILRQKWKILGFVAIVGLATYLYSARLTPIYEATALIDIDRQMPGLPLGQEAAQTLAAEDSDEFLATQTEIIQSDAVLRPVVMKFDLLRKENDLDKLPTEKRKKPTNSPVYLRHMGVFRDFNTYILRITYRSSDPNLASDVANAVAESYLRHSFEIRIRSSIAMSHFMEQQLDELRAKMERSSLALGKFEREMGVVNPEERTNILSSRLLQLNTEYTAAEADRVRKESAYRAMADDTLAAAQISSQSGELNALYDRLNGAKQRLASVSTIYGPAHAEYRKAANDLAELQRQFDEMRREVKQRVTKEYEEAASRETMLKRTVDQTKAEWDELNSRSFQYQQLRRDADADRALYGDLDRRVREAGINAGFQNNSIRIADYARPPAGPILPRISRNVTLAVAISLFLAMCAAILVDLLDTTIRDPEQASRALDVSVIGALPRVKDMRRLTMTPRVIEVGEDAGKEGAGRAKSSSLVLYGPLEKTNDSGEKPRERKRSNSPSSAGVASYEEAIRTLRHSILLPDLDREVRTLLLTSATPGEGKSTAILHLAIAHAEAGKRTLIIDADMRRPSISKKLNIDVPLGLSDVLLGKRHWRESIVTSDMWNELDVLPSGQASRRASDLVGPAMVDILDEAAKDYDMIFVDAPPLLGFAEAMQIATAVDGVVVIARAGHTGRRAVATVFATLKRLRANVVGLVLNEVDKNTSHGYYYYYSDYRKYYAESSAKS